VNDERWYDLIERIRTKFTVTLEEEHPPAHGPGKVQVVEFEGAGGRMRIERVTRPVVLERRMHYSKRLGGQSSEEFVYAENEFSHRVTLYRWVEGSWQEEDYRGMMGSARG
jgi:hypothetical protein